MAPVTLARRILALLLLLLAAMVSASTGTYFYLEQRNPTDASTVKRMLASSEVEGKFRVEDAKKSGYSESEIAAYLAEQNRERNAHTMQRLLLAELALLVASSLIGAAVYFFRTTGARVPSK